MDPVAVNELGVALVEQFRFRQSGRVEDAGAVMFIMLFEAVPSTTS